MQLQEESKNTYVIPQNYEDNLITASGIKIRNVIEGIILLAITGGLIWLLPIDSIKIRIVMIIVFGGGLGVFGVIGIHHYSLSEFIMLVVKYKASTKKLERSDIFEKDELEKE